MVEVEVDKLADVEAKLNAKDGADVVEVGVEVDVEVVVLADAEEPIPNARVGAVEVVEVTDGVVLDKEKLGKAEVLLAPEVAVALAVVVIAVVADAGDDVADEVVGVWKENWAEG